MTKEQLQLLRDIATELTIPISRPDRAAIEAILAERAELLTTLKIVRHWIAGEFEDEPNHSADAEETLGLVENVLGRANGGT